MRFCMLKKLCVVTAMMMCHAASTSANQQDVNPMAAYGGKLQEALELENVDYLVEEIKKIKGPKQELMDNIFSWALQNNALEIILWIGQQTILPLPSQQSVDALFVKAMRDKNAMLIEFLLKNYGGNEWPAISQAAVDFVFEQSASIQSIEKVNLLLKVYPRAFPLPSENVLKKLMGDALKSEVPTQLNWLLIEPQQNQGNNFRKIAINSDMFSIEDLKNAVKLLAVSAESHDKQQSLDNAYSCLLSNNKPNGCRISKGVGLSQQTKKVINEEYLKSAVKMNAIPDIFIPLQNLSNDLYNAPLNNIQALELMLTQAVNAGVSARFVAGLYCYIFENKIVPNFSKSASDMIKNIGPNALDVVIKEFIELLKIEADDKLLMRYKDIIFSWGNEKNSAFKIDSSEIEKMYQAYKHDLERSNRIGQVVYAVLKDNRSLLGSTNSAIKGILR